MRAETLRVFIGYDSKEPVALEVLVHSLVRRASRPLAFIPVAVNHLTGVYTRERGATESTEFSLTRFLVPYLAGYHGLAIFMDCDMVCLTDIYDVLEHVRSQPGKAVWVCQHDYEPTSEKFLGQRNTSYPMKNWSSFMVMDTAKCSALTPEYVNSASGLQVHRFQWLEPEDIGSIPIEWNWLVGEYPHNPHAKNLHYTLGTPCFHGYERSDHADMWYAEYAAMSAPLKAWINGHFPQPAAVPATKTSLPWCAAKAGAR